MKERRGMWCMYDQYIIHWLDSWSLFEWFIYINLPLAINVLCSIFFVAVLFVLTIYFFFVFTMIKWMKRERKNYSSIKVDAFMYEAMTKRKMSNLLLYILYYLPQECYNSMSEYMQKKEILKELRIVKFKLISFDIKFHQFLLPCYYSYYLMC